MDAAYRMMAVVIAAAAWGQTPRAEFEVASIKPAPPMQQGTATAGVRIDGAQIRCSNFSLKDFLGMAYRLKAYQITGPDSIASERFDLAAKLPEGSKPSE